MPTAPTHNSGAPPLPAAPSSRYVDGYHVDSEAGLRLLADTIVQMPPLHPLLAALAAKAPTP